MPQVQKILANRTSCGGFELPPIVPLVQTLPPHPGHTDVKDQLKTILELSDADGENDAFTVGRLTQCIALQ